MNGYKTATVHSGDKTVLVNLNLIGSWSAADSADHNWLVALDAKLETALSRALDSDDGVGVSRDKSVTVTCHR